MKIPRPLLLGLGIGIVFVTASRTLEAMGAQNAIRACFVAGIIATFLIGALSR